MSRNRFQQALSARTDFETTMTNAYRLVDGRGDALPGLEVDRLGEHILISTRDVSLAPEVVEFFAPHATSIYHKVLDSHTKQSPQHVLGPEIDRPFRIRENQVNFELSFQSGYSQGIFLDQRDNRQHLRSLLKPGDTLLNTFAYTGAFSVYGALAGATTTTIDLSQPYLDWSKRHLELNDISPSTQYFCKGDTFHWLRRFAKQGRRFDAIVLDPPTFSRDKDGKVFRVEKDYPRLIELAAGCLARGGTILACTNYRQMGEQEFMGQIRGALARPVELTSSPMPHDFTAPPYLKSIWIR